MSALPQTAAFALSPMRDALPADRNPAAVYLAGLSEGASRDGMRRTLEGVARLLGVAVGELPWHELRHQHVALIRSRLEQAGRAPATINKTLAALRGTLQAAADLDLCPQGVVERVRRRVPLSKGSRLPAGRALPGDEIRRLFDACADDGAAGHRDACAFALLYGCGLRRNELAGLPLSAVDLPAGVIRVVGKGNRQRLAFVHGGIETAIRAWLPLRGYEPGALLCPVRKDGTVLRGRAMTGGALAKRLKRRARQAGIEDASPHDLRRSFVTDTLAAGVDLASAQQLAGHASPVTTTIYDRRGEEEAARAARVIHVPVVSR